MSAEHPKPAGAPDSPAQPAGAPEAPTGAAGAPSGAGGSEEAAELVNQDLVALEETKRERDSYLELAQRTKADFENYRKRMAAETEAAVLRAKAELAKDLVGVVDNLERALATAHIDPQEVDGELTADQGLEHGVLLTFRELQGTLERAGVEPIDPAGERFDPNWHEALSTRPADGIEPGVVIDVVQRGYRLDGQLIRPARVVVSE